jgi:hypothetical protein
VTQTHPDPVEQWSEHLARLDPVRRDAVASALRHSASRGRPATREGVDLLVSYALGEITSRQYAAGIVRSWRGGGDADPPPVEPAPAPPSPPEPPARLERHEAVHAYVTGQIDVGEFLRITRG